MNKYFLISALIFSVISKAQDKNPQSTEVWEIQPRVVTPGTSNFNPPSDAIVLFDGKDLSNFKNLNGEKAEWTVKDGAFTVGKGDIKTKQLFGDIQLHIEWKSPEKIEGDGQGRGNSGIFLCEQYEVQVLDNYNNKTYGNGQAGSIYKQYPPLVNACKKPNEWQTYDIVFIMPRLNKEGRMIEPAKITVFHNGILIQNNVSLLGVTEYIGLPTYKNAEKASIKLQDHGNPVSFRNIWVREL